jgi:hypothetical protein
MIIIRTWHLWVYNNDKQLVLQLLLLHPCEGEKFIVVSSSLSCKIYLKCKTKKYHRFSLKEYKSPPSLWRSLMLLADVPQEERWIFFTSILLSPTPHPPPFPFLLFSWFPLFCLVCLVFSWSPFPVAHPPLLHHYQATLSPYHLLCASLLNGDLHESQIVESFGNWFLILFAMAWPLFGGSDPTSFVACLVVCSFR